jgi:hypothetical protein
MSRHRPAGGTIQPGPAAADDPYSLRTFGWSISRATIKASPIKAGARSGPTPNMDSIAACCSAGSAPKSTAPAAICTDAMRQARRQSLTRVMAASRNSQPARPLVEQQIAGQPQRDPHGHSLGARKAHKRQNATGYGHRQALDQRLLLFGPVRTDSYPNQRNDDQQADSSDVESDQRRTLRLARRHGPRLDDPTDRTPDHHYLLAGPP